MPASKLVRNSLVFGTAEVINRALPFLLLPVLTRVLPAADYGIVATFMVVVSVLGAIAGLSSHGSVNVAFFRIERSELPAYVTSVLTILAGSTAIVALILAASGPIIRPWTHISTGWMLAALLVASSQFVTLVNLVLWQAEERSVAHSIYQFSQALTATLLSLAFVVLLRWGWRGQVLSVVAASAVFAIISLIVLARRGMLRRPADMRYVTDALQFGVPLVPHVLAAWLITGIDRFFLNAYAGAESTGIYAAAYQVGLIVSVPAAAFNRAWVPYLFRQLSEGGAQGRRLVVQVTYSYFAVILAGALLLAWVAKLALPFVLGAAFERSADMVVWIALGYAFNGMYLMVVNQLFYAKRTGWLVIATVVTGVTHAIVSFALIRAFGARGAAMATTFSFAVMFLATWVISARICPLPWRLGRTTPDAPEQDHRGETP